MERVFWYHCSRGAWSGSCCRVVSFGDRARWIWRIHPLPWLSPVQCLCFTIHHKDQGCVLRWASELKWNMTIPGIAPSLHGRRALSRLRFVYGQEGAVKEAGVVSAFDTLVPETHTFHVILSKIFRKKIKRAKVWSIRMIGHTVPMCRQLGDELFCLWLLLNMVA